MSSPSPEDAARATANSIKGLADSAFDKARHLFDGASASQPLTTVDSVDLKRYVGKWYELARLPILVQPDDTVSTAEYTLKDDGTVRVLNTSFQDDKKHKHEILGTATPAKGAEKTNARLKVKFDGLAALAPVPDEGNYWIFCLNDSYDLALVGTPDRRHLWLLSKNEYAWGGAEADSYIAWARDNGFDVDKLLVDNWATFSTLPVHAHQ